MKSKQIYISGPISTNVKRARLCFAEAEAELLTKGLVSVNPMKLAHVHDGSWEAFMKEDISAMCKCDAIYMLKGWRHSRGAQLEHFLAQELGMEIMYEDQPGRDFFWKRLFK